KPTEYQEGSQQCDHRRGRLQRQMFRLPGRGKGQLRNYGKGRAGQERRDRRQNNRGAHTPHGATGGEDRRPQPVVPRAVWPPRGKQADGTAGNDGRHGQPAREGSRGITPTPAGLLLAYVTRPRRGTRLRDRMLSWADPASIAVAT